MKVQGITLIEIVTAIALIAIISLCTVYAFSTAGGIFRRSEAINESAEIASAEIAEAYHNPENYSGNFCFLKISDSITITGEIINSNSTETGFSGYTIVKPLHNDNPEDSNEDN